MSPIMYFVMYNSIVQAKVPKIIVPIKQNFKNSIFTIYKIDYFDNNRHRQSGSKCHNDFQYFG